jgi:hypothetical protein
LTFT